MRGLGVAVVLTALLGALPVNAHPLQAQGAAPATESGATAADALRVRTALGMRADSEYIAQSLTDARQFPEDPMAVPMTVEEAAEVWRRLDVQDAIDPVAVWAEANVDGYAGMFMDQSAGGKPVFLVKSGFDAGPL